MAAVRAENQKKEIKERAAKYQNLQPSIKALVVSLKKLKIKTEIGINYQAYDSAVGEVYPEAKVFLESTEAKDLPELVFLLSNACDCYLKIRDLWSAKVRLSQDNPELLNDALLMIYAPKYLWPGAASNIDFAERLVGGNAEDCATVQKLLKDSETAEKLKMQYFLALAKEQEENANKRRREEAK